MCPEGQRCGPFGPLIGSSEPVRTRGSYFFAAGVAVGFGGRGMARGRQRVAEPEDKRSASAFSTSVDNTAHASMRFLSLSLVTPATLQALVATTIGPVSL